MPMSKQRVCVFLNIKALADAGTHATGVAGAIVWKCMQIRLAALLKTKDIGLKPF